MMKVSNAGSRTLNALDDGTRELVRLSAVVTAGAESDIRSALAHAADAVPGVWVEELLLQSYLFAGFPRALNAMREWRRVSGVQAATASGAREPEDIRAAGEATCAAVYGSMYEALRRNIRELHPLLDEWMVMDGYGKVLSRPELDLGRRELCIVAACAAAGQERQLLSHLHGALNVGVPASVVEASLDALHGIVSESYFTSARLLWLRVRGK